MSVYMTRINGWSLDDMTHYKQHMTFNIAQRLGIKEMGIYRYNGSNESEGNLSARVDGIIAGINRGDLVICQFPTGNGLRFEWRLVSTLKAYGARIAVFLQDIEQGANIWEIANLYNQAEVMIVSSLAMRQFLIDNNVNREMKFVIQEMWDYTDDFMRARAPEFKKEFAVIEEEQFSGIQEWPFQLPVKIYGGKNIQGNPNVHNINGLRSEEVFNEISRGGFGLVWDRNIRDSQYTERGVSFSMAKFLAAGLPVIVPAGISNQAIIKKNRLGLVVHSLEEALAKVEAMEREEYQEYVRHVENFAPALRKGYYTEKCLIEAMQAFYREDFDRLSTPAKVFSLDDSAFTVTVLKESYGGNLALSWSFRGNVDGFLVYDSDGRIVSETDNVHQHYCLIEGYGRERGFTVRAYVETLKGKLVVAESELTCLDTKIYEGPEVSMIIPAYNAEEYVIRSIDTALAQTFANLEIVIVDDGSTDATSDILDWYAEKYPNVKVSHQVNKGLPAARNAGIAQAGGRYIGFLDSDDMIRPDMAERLYSSAKNNDCDIAVTSAYFITSTGYEISPFTMCSVEENCAVDADRFIDANRTPVVWNKLYRASLVKEHPFFLTAYEDNAWSPYILSFANKICYINEGLYEYDRSIRASTLIDELETQSGDEIFMNHKRAILFYLENGNPARIKILKKVAQRELDSFARGYKNDKYKQLKEQIAQM